MTSGRLPGLRRVDDHVAARGRSSAGSRRPRRGRGRRRVGHEALGDDALAACRRSSRATCCCWCGGKKSMMRLIVSGASTVWSVENTRWPVSAARQRGLDRLLVAHLADQDHVRVLAQDAAQGALEGRRCRCPTSRWLMTERWSRCRNSIGSSIVTMCLRIVSLMWSIIAASVVDLPEPVVPVSRMIPRSSSASSRIDRRAGRARSIVLIDVRDRAHDDRDRAALAEGVDAEAREAGDRRRRSRPRSRPSNSASLVGVARASRGATPLGVLGAQRLGARDRD